MSPEAQEYIKSKNIEPNIPSIDNEPSKTEIIFVVLGTIITTFLFVILPPEDVNDISQSDRALLCFPILLVTWGPVFGIFIFLGSKVGSFIAHHFYKTNTSATMGSLAGIIVMGACIVIWSILRQ